MGDLPIRISWDLMAIGALSSVLAVFLRGLILKIEDWPRLANNWKLTPSIFGAIGIMLYPEAAPGLSWPLLICHGLASPAIAYAAYPYIKKYGMLRVQSMIPGGNETAALPKKEGEP